MRVRSTLQSKSENGGISTTAQPGMPCPRYSSKDFLPGGHHGRGHRRHVMASPYHPNDRLHTRSSRDNMVVVITIDVDIALKLTPGSWWWTYTSVVSPKPQPPEAIYEARLRDGTVIYRKVDIADFDVVPFSPKDLEGCPHCKQPYRPGTRQA